MNVELLSGPTENQRRVLQVELRMQRGTKGKRVFPIGEERESVPVDFRSHLYAQSRVSEGTRALGEVAGRTFDNS